MGRRTKTFTFNYDDRFTAGPEEDLDFEEQQDAVIEGFRNIVKEQLSAEMLQNISQDPLQLGGMFAEMILEETGHVPFEPTDVFEELAPKWEEKRQAAFAKIAEGLAELADLTIDHGCEGLEETVQILEERGELN